MIMENAYTPAERRKIANQISAFAQAGKKEIAYRNPFTDEVTVYEVDLQSNDKIRLADICEDLLNAKAENS